MFESGDWSHQLEFGMLTINRNQRQLWTGEILSKAITLIHNSPVSPPAFTGTEHLFPLLDIISEDIFFGL